MQSQKAVLKLDLNDDEEKKKTMEIASGFAGAESIAVDMKDEKLTVVRTTDPVELVEKLGKPFPTEIVSVGPAKEAQKDDRKKNNLVKKKNADGYVQKYMIEPQSRTATRGQRWNLSNIYKKFKGEYNINDLGLPPLYNYGRYPSAEDNTKACVIL